MKKFDVDREMQEWKVLATTVHSQAALMRIEPGGKEGGPGNRHDADQWLFVVEGTAHVTVNGDEMNLGPNTLLLIEQGDEHEVANRSDQPLMTLNFYGPPAYPEEG